MLSLRRGLLLQYDASRTAPYPYALIRSPLIIRQSVQTLGIVGIGRMGTAVALRAKVSVVRLILGHFTNSSLSGPTNGRCLL